MDPTRIGTVLLPAHNEAAVIADTLHRVAHVLRSQLPERDWEVLVVDDGSTDDTAGLTEIAAAALTAPGLTVRLLRHLRNRGLGGALQTGFAASTGDVVVVVDCDLSYHPDHIPGLVRAVEDGRAQIAVASPYMPGGRTIGIPAGVERRSRMANRFLAALSDSDLHTFTGMVRAYDGPFIRELALKSLDDIINVETLYKTGLLHGRVVEVPATLDWSGLSARAARNPLLGRRTRAKTLEMLVRGVLYRPYLVFAIGSVLLAAVGAGLGLGAMLAPGEQVGLTVLGVSLLVAGFSSGLVSVLSMQVKRGFEELYYQQSPARRLIPSMVADPAPAVVPLDVVPLQPPPDGAAARAPDPLLPQPPPGATVTSATSDAPTRTTR
jgi:glycosyltransferase involved in cell wall biosynthesis